jgi:hypothetical protein
MVVSNPANPVWACKQPRPSGNYIYIAPYSNNLMRKTPNLPGEWDNTFWEEVRIFCQFWIRTIKYRKGHPLIGLRRDG